MALTPEQIKEAREKFGIKPANEVNRKAELESLWGRESGESRVDMFRREAEGAESAFEQTKPFFSRVGEKLEQRGEKLAEIQEGGLKGRELIPATGQYFGGFQDVIGEAMTSVFRSLPEDAKTRLKEEGSKILESPGIGDLLRKDIESIQKLQEGFGEFEKTHPDVAANVRGLTNIGMTFLDMLGLSAVKEPAKKVAKEVIPDLLKTGKETLKTGLDAFQAKRLQRLGDKVFKETEIIEDLIAPKLTAKETRKIISEGRVERGAKGGLKERLFGSKPDVVTQSEGVERAAETIQRTIQGASKMDDFKLVQEMRGQIDEISTALKPEMQGVMVDKTVMDKAIGVWEKAKKLQADNPEFVAFAGSKRAQSNFEAFLNEARKSVRDTKTGQFTEKTLDDLWDIRIRYDSSISRNVKQAVDGVSPPSTVLQKEMWLENRRILNDVINSTADGLGDTSKKAFSDMTDFYMARENIATKSKILLEGDPGLIRKNLLKWGLGVGGSFIAGSIVF